MSNCVSFINFLIHSIDLCNVLTGRLGGCFDSVDRAAMAIKVYVSSTSGSLSVCIPTF